MPFAPFMGTWRSKVGAGQLNEPTLSSRQMYPACCCGALHHGDSDVAVSFRACVALPPIGIALNHALI